MQEEGTSRQQQCNDHDPPSNRLYLILISIIPLPDVYRRQNLSVADFQAQYERPNRPVILTDIVPTWPATRTWDRQYLSEVLGHHDVIVGNMPMPFDAYLSYCDNNCEWK